MQTGFYTKVGRLVTIYGRVENGVITTASANANIIQGLPFTPSTDAVGIVGEDSNLTTGCVACVAANGSDSLTLLNANGLGINENWLNNNGIAFNITYTT